MLACHSCALSWYLVFISGSCLTMYLLDSWPTMSSHGGNMLVSEVSGSFAKKKQEN